MSNSEYKVLRNGRWSGLFRRNIDFYSVAILSTSQMRYLTNAIQSDADRYHRMYEIRIGREEAGYSGYSLKSVYKKIKRVIKIIC